MAEDAVSVKKEEAEKTGVKDWLEKSRDGKPDKLHFGFARVV